MAERGDSRPGGETGGIERAGAIVAELAEACGTALAALVEEERERAAERIRVIAEAARSAARSLDQSESPVTARTIARLAAGIDDIADLVRERGWREIAADAAEFARRRPGIFSLGAASLGFLAGRLFGLPADREPSTDAGEERREVP